MVCVRREARNSTTLRVWCLAITSSTLATSGISPSTDLPAWGENARTASLQHIGRSHPGEYSSKVGASQQRGIVTSIEGIWLASSPRGRAVTRTHTCTRHPYTT